MDNKRMPGEYANEEERVCRAYDMAYNAGEPIESPVVTNIALMNIAQTLAKLYDFLSVNLLAL